MNKTVRNSLLAMFIFGVTSGVLNDLTPMKWLSFTFTCFAIVAGIVAFFVAVKEVEV